MLKHSLLVGNSQARHSNREKSVSFANQFPKGQAKQLADEQTGKPESFLNSSSGSLVPTPRESSRQFQNT